MLQQKVFLSPQKFKKRSLRYAENVVLFESSEMIIFSANNVVQAEFCKIGRAKTDWN
jgi:hypothetical protein